MFKIMRYTFILVCLLPVIIIIIFIYKSSHVQNINCVRIASPKFNYLKRNESNDETTDPDENNVSVDIFKELGVSDRNNPLALINAVQLHQGDEYKGNSIPQTRNPMANLFEENPEEAPFVFSIVRVVILQDYPESSSESDEKLTEEKGKTEEKNLIDGNFSYDSTSLSPFAVLFSIPREPDMTSSPTEAETQSQKEKDQEKTGFKEIDDSSKNSLSDSMLLENKLEEEKKTPEELVESNLENHPLPAKVLPSDSTKATLVTKDETGELHNMYYDFMDFSIPNSFVCPEDGKNMNLLVGIHSDVENFEQRKAIRETWSKVAGMEGLNYAFIVGIGISDSIDNKVKHESDEFQDIIQTDILARHQYRDANPVMFLKWVKKYCPLVKYVIKSDDNVFLNLPLISKLIRENEVKENVMYGDLHVDELPDRNPNSEDYVPKELFTGDTYPKFLNRAGYLFSGKLAPVLYEEARKFPYFPRENILITGIVAEKLNITRQDTSDLFIEYTDVEKQIEKCSFLKYTIVYPVSPSQMKLLWDEIKSTDYKCFNFLENMLEMINVKGDADNIYDQQVELYNLLNDVTPSVEKNKKYKDELE